jgi:hypothetical protein
VQKIGETVELKEPVPRPGHWRSSLDRQLLQRCGIEAAFEMDVHLGLWQSDQRVLPYHGSGLGHCVLKSLANYHKHQAPPIADRHAASHADDNLSLTAPVLGNPHWYEKRIREAEKQRLNPPNHEAVATRIPRFRHFCPCGRHD